MLTPENLPEEFVNRIKIQLKDEYPDFFNSLRSPAPVSIRLNPTKHVARDGEKIPWCETGRYLQERPLFTLDPTFHGGSYYVQEASSMFLEQVIQQAVDVTKPLRVLDACAAPGGKSTHLLTLLNEDSLLVSNEVIRSRANILSENIQKWGNANVMVTNNDPTNFSSLKGYFDIILIDAPCSGEGLFRKDINAAQEWSEKNMELCSLRQRRIVADLWPALKENGLLIYSTCTYNEKENEDNLNWISKAFSSVSESIRLNPNWGVEAVQQNNVKGYRFFPHRVKGEGFFISAIRKKEGTPQLRLYSKKKDSEPLNKKSTAILKEWITNPTDTNFYQWKDLIYMVPASLQEEMEFLRSNLHVIHIGTPVATQKHAKFIPEQALGLSTKIAKNNFLNIDLDLENALKYLRKDQLDIQGSTKGYALMSFEDIPLGWANMLGNRINNMYPTPWRIRMQNNT